MLKRVFKKWDIWWARIPYEDDKTKMTIRPALIMSDSYGDDKVNILTYKITKNITRQIKEKEDNKQLGIGNVEEFKIEDTFIAGLPEEVSTIRITKKLKLPQSEFPNKERIGVLSDRDKERFKKQIKLYKQIEKNKKQNIEYIDIESIDNTNSLKP